MLKTLGIIGSIGACVWMAVSSLGGPLTDNWQHFPIKAEDYAAVQRLSIRYPACLHRFIHDNARRYRKLVVLQDSARSVCSVELQPLAALLAGKGYPQEIVDRETRRVRYEADPDMSALARAALHYN